MTEWRRVRVGGLATTKGLVGGPFGSSLGSKDYVESGVPVIRGINLGSKSKFSGQEFVFVAPEKAHGELARNIAIPGDIVFTQRGTLGQVGIVPSFPFDKYVISQSQMRLRVDPNIAITEFVYYQFRSPEMIRTIHSRAITTGVPHINLGILGDLEITLPPLSEQRAIATVLGALDDKIAVNERIATTGDELLTASFSSSLVMNPQQFIDQPLSRTAEFVNGRAFTKDATGSGRMVIRIAEINSGPGPSTIYNEIDVPDRHLARPGDVLFAWSGSLTVARWYRPESIINQHIFKVIPKNGMAPWLAFELIRLKLAEFRGIAADKATTMGHIQRRHLDEPVPVPTTELLARLDTELGPLWDRALAAEQESLALTALRDALLPQLMSGRLRVRDAEQIVEDAL
ncbi:restriction endonuclease subunit S [Nonomuraea sp. JJY05]|uniref:restriction endonuclease subunit S n=1 Tax=Nonomuraea sp. JJY05 TaxID=3350255 RepID=UPI00373F10AF